MSLRRWSDALVTATVILSIASYAVAERFPALVVVAIPAALLGWYLTDVRGIAVARRPISDLLVLAAIAWSAYRVRSVGWVQGLTVSVFCEFLVAIILVKMWDRKLPRDSAQILTLSVFLSVGSMLTGASLGMAVILLCNLALLVLSVALFHITSGAAAATLPDGERPARGPLAAGPGARRHFTLTVLFALAMGLVISVVVFLVMPRGIGSGVAGTFGQITGGRQTGLTDHVDLRQSGLISQSARTVLRAQFWDIRGDPLGADGRVFYLRASVLDTYDRSTWTGPSDADEPPVREDVRPQTPVRLGGVPGENGIVQAIEMLDAPRRTPLPHVYRAVEAWSDRISTFRGDRSIDTLSREGEPGRLKYTITSAPPALPRSETFRRGYTATFPVPEVREIAERVLLDAGIEPEPDLRPRGLDYEACLEIERYLRANFTYTLDTPAAPRSADPIVWFLTRSRVGHCEFFASAMAGMCRSVGIDTRVIAGYAAGEFDADSRTYTVRESNAHAWVEAEIARGVWWTFDPTPPDTLRSRLRPPSGLAAAWGRWLDRINTNWSDSFISFDERSRRKLIGFEADPEPWLRTRLDALRTHFNEEGWRGAVPIILRAAAWTVGACAVAIVAMRLSRSWLGRVLTSIRRRAALRADPDLARALGHTEFFRRAMALLKKRGYARPPWQPPLAFAAEVAARDPGLGRAAGLAADLYYRARYGRHSPSEAEIGAVNRALDEAARF